MNELKNSKILIIGGAGFVGSFTADLLLDEDAKEIILVDNLIRGSEDNIKNAVRSGKVKFVKGDIRDVKLLNEVFEGVDYCFHMAALRITRCRDNPKEALEIMHQGTFNVVEACIEHKIKKLVAASSASVYGQADNFPTKETHHPYNNRTLYGALKLANELMYRAFSDTHGLKYVGLRYFNIYGPRMDTEGAYTEVLVRWYYLIKEGKPPLIFGDGDQTMDFVYIEDVARSNILAMKSSVADKIFNIACGKETSLKELCLLFLEVMRSDIKPRFLPLPNERNQIEVRRRLAEVSQAKTHIDFEAKVPLREGLKKLVAWLDKKTEKLSVIT